MTKVNQKEKIIIDIDENVRNIQYELDENLSSRRWYDSAIFAISIIIIGWIIHPFNIKGNQIIEICLISILIWFLYYFFFFSIPKSKNIFKTVKLHFDRYYGLTKEERDEIHSDVDRATLHLSKSGRTSSIMFLYVLALLLILIISPYYFDDVSINIIDKHPIITILILLYLGLITSAVVRLNKSMEKIHVLEKTLEKQSFEDDKTKQIIEKFRLKKFGTWFYVILGNSPIIFTILFLIYFFLINLQFFDLPYSTLVVVLILQIILQIFLRRRYLLASKISIGYQILNNLKNLKNNIRKNKIRSITKIKQEFDNILYVKLSRFKN